MPIYFFVYDIEKYSQDVGVNFNFETEAIGKYKAVEADGLIKLLDENYDYQVFYEFKNKYISIDTKECTKQIVEFIARLMRNEQVEDMGNEPIKEKYNI